VKKIFLLSLFFVFFLALPKTALGYHYKEVLAAESTNLTIPPTVEGPGIFLPDSPFFFLDEIKQNVRLLLAYTSEQKATVHSAIAGERMAELRYMLAANNEKGIGVALNGVNENFKDAAEDLSQARFSGREVSVLAKQINDQIKEKINVLSELEDQTTGEKKLVLNTVSSGLFKSKVKIEDGLSESDLKNEIRDDLNWKAERDLRQTNDSATELKMSLEDLRIEATQSANSSLKRRESALQQAIAEKNTELLRTEQKLLEQEKLQQYNITKLSEDALKDATAIVENATAVSEKFGQLKLKSSTDN